MKKKTKIILTASTLAILSLMVTVQQLQPQTQPEPTDIPPVSSPMQVDRDNTPPTESKAVVADGSPEISTQNPPQDNTCTKTDFEPPTAADSKESMTENSPPGDNPTTAPAPPNNTTAAKACEPKMGDTRTAKGQKQSYFLGFGWVDYMGENEVIYCEGMYENGNKIGIMGGGIFVDGDGDINKMVGIMD